ncbi:hypothetical protein DSUL_20419 [Desulfovibrionales bacterium]
MRSKEQDGSSGTKNVERLAQLNLAKVIYQNKYERLKATAYLKFIIKKTSHPWPELSLKTFRTDQIKKITNVRL